MCLEVNKRSNTFEKALLCILLISYIQPFEDGNKRTGTDCRQWPPDERK
ncbi:MAG: Fic family protein [Saprospirales bacterium]|nr:Fic family protein [Saprospirales bacterium]